MIYIPKRKSSVVNRCGAPAGAILLGTGRNNLGLRLQILQDQPRGSEGALQGRFVILDTGTNLHSEALRELLHRPTDAQEVLFFIRREHPCCINVVNVNSLVVEPAGAPPPVTPPHLPAWARLTGTGRQA